MEVLQYPDPRLRLPNEPLKSWSPEIEAKVKQMREVLSRVRGVGLAAPQVGWNVQIFILTLAGNDQETRERVIFNPTMTPIGQLKLMGEGCLSFTGIFAQIPRYDRVRLIGKTPEGDLDEILSGFEAHAVQHEMDHLAGTLFIDKMSPKDRQLNAPFLKEMEDNWRKQHPNE